MIRSLCPAHDGRNNREKPEGEKNAKKRSAERARKTLLLMFGSLAVIALGGL